MRRLIDLSVAIENDRPADPPGAGPRVHLMSSYLPNLR